ncbi:MAG: hypothetical protein LBU90_06655 [Bacteroidales bacterium]|jgi:hypothetical protein|nr:hypothetical protein [Bacteroidales bacterium]
MELIIVDDFDLQSPKWLDIIFAKGNKLYGAYDLRNDSSNRHLKAVIIVSVCVALLMVLLPYAVRTVAEVQKAHIAMTEELKVAMINQMEEEEAGSSVAKGEEVKGDDAAGDMSGVLPPITIIKESTSPETTNKNPETITQTDVPAVNAKEEEFKARMQGTMNRNLLGNGGTSTENFGNSTQGAAIGRPGHPDGSPFSRNTKGTPGNPFGNGDATKLVKPLNTTNCDKIVELRVKIDADGNVTDITEIETAISEQNCIEAAKQAAKKTKFPADAAQAVRFARISYDYSVAQR